MLLNDFMPEFHFSERHQAKTLASPRDIFRSITTMDLSESSMVKFLYYLRRMPRTSMTLAGMNKIGFKIIGTTEDKELVIGLIGRFWKPIPEMVDIPTEQFTKFNKKGYAKVAFNYFIEETAQGNVLSTETRIFCTSSSSRVAFSVYWAIIRPFSGLIRRAMLKGILKGAGQYAT